MLMLLVPYWFDLSVCDFLQHVTWHNELYFLDIVREP